MSKTSRIAFSPQAQIGKVHPFIYGHFIEHLLECLYNGLWAEMLQNRKFAGHDQPPKGRVSAEQYGIVYPWVAANRNPNVRYSHDNTIYYNGLQSQRIEIMAADGNAHGIAQGGLALRAGQRYDVRIVLSAAGLAGPVRVALGQVTQLLPTVGPGWQTFSFSLAAQADDDAATFAITFDAPGKLWIGAVSLMPADNVQGWRRDVVALCKELKVPVLRYPGGNFVSGYHWQDGIGDRDRRPIRYDYAWNVWETNDVGIDEFMVLRDLLDCEPYISVNAGNGTAAEAAAWVEYCNGAANTVYGTQRAANGHPTPYDIKYWGIGNEMYGNWQIGHCDAETFGHRHVAFAQAMRAVDPSLILLAVGDMPDQPGEWLETVTKLAGEYIDLMTVHHYTRVPADVDELAQDAMAVACPDHIETLLVETRRILDQLGPQGHEIAISFDEWNVTHPMPGHRQNYALRDGLYAAGMFNAFQRQCRSVTMTNIAQMVNLLGVIETSPTDVYGTPIFHAFKLYVDHCGEVALKTVVESETFDVPAFSNIPALKGVSYLSASATLDSQRHLICLAVVNRHSSADLAATIEAGGVAANAQAQVWEMNGPSMGSRNTFNAHDTVTSRAKGTVAAGSRFSYTFPAHSLTMIEIPAQ
jgi:alpha-L-arabinofuranosidase